jgi:serine/threonine protein kinase
VVADESVNNEVKLLSSMKHPNIIGYYGSFFDDKSCFNILMEYADGEAALLSLACIGCTESRARAVLASCMLLW